MGDLFEQGWAKLSVEVRLEIWRLAYELEGPRLVEVGTAEHDHSSCRSWCPRYSPSPPPTIVNVCREAREEARRIAQRDGHLLFATTPNAPDIYFNPAIDTLYVLNDKKYQIRDCGWEGVLTQFQMEHEANKLCCLAISIDPLERSTTPCTMLLDIRGSTKLRSLSLVVKEVDQKVFERMWRSNYLLALNVLRTSRYPPVECMLAIKRGRRLELVRPVKLKCIGKELMAIAWEDYVVPTEI